MGTGYTTTTSNRAQITPDTIDAVKAIIDEYDFAGAFTTLTVDVTDPDDEDIPPYLKIYGGADFDVSKPGASEDNSCDYHEDTYTNEFLTRLTAHLTEQLVIETVSVTKYRFPLFAGQWVAWPDGTVVYNSFDHSPEKPSDADEAADLPPSA
jgi:hypothetical protein